MNQPTIEALRQHHQYFEALDRITADLLHGDRESWREHFLARPCLLTEMSRSCRGSGQEQACRDWLSGRPFSKLKVAYETSPGHCPGVSDLLETRSKVLLAGLADQMEPSRIEESLRFATKEYAAAWNLPPQAISEQAHSNERIPAGLNHLDSGFLTIFQEKLAPEFGWFHPGLLMVGETLAFLWSDQESLPVGGKQINTVSTWVLLVDETESSAQGGLARLTMERVPQGCGAVYPHPLMAAYLPTQKLFSDGWQLAWAKTLSLELATCDFDVRWWVQVRDPNPATRHLPWDVVLNGPSAQAAFAGAFRALQRDEELDPTVAMTAQFHTRDPADQELAPIGGLEEKLTLFQAELEQIWIQEVVVADNQPLEAQRLGSGKIQLHPAKSLADAYERMSRFPRLTNDVKTKIAQQAREKLAEHCGGEGRYIPSHISRFSPDKMVQDPDQCWERLSLDDQQKITLGLLPESENRVRILAPSGLGKTALTYYAQWQIAERQDGRIPIRLDRLSAVIKDWTGEAKDILLRVLENRLQGVLPTEGDFRERETRYQWLRSLIAQAKVVFLPDALDQTTRDMEDLGVFFHKEDINRCPVLLTGRDEVTTTRSPMFQEENAKWQTYRVDAFDEEQIRDYLGDLAPKLLSQGWDDPLKGFKENLQELLKVPVLLSLLRDLVAGEGAVRWEELTNRHAVYYQALDEFLVSHGWKKLVETEANPFRNKGQVRKFLKQLAWSMLFSPHPIPAVSEDGAALVWNFTNSVSDSDDGEDFSELLDLLPSLENNLNALAQVNITMLEQSHQGDEVTGVGWRHLSFCEFYAGLYLAELPQTVQAQAVETIQRITETKVAKAQDPRQWEWVFRFALSHLSAQNKQRDLDHFAQCLIQYGNPFVVYRAISEDGVALSPELDQLCRWLVHRDDSGRGAYQQTAPPTVSDLRLPVFEKLFDRRYRNSGCLAAAWELIAEAPWAKPLRKKFLGEFSGFLSTHNPTATAFQTRFHPCPQGEVPIPASFAMAETPITNLQYELFDPSHHFLRDQSSQSDDQPVIKVSWHMANLFCRWLGSREDGWRYRLPKEAEWEFACRAGTPPDWDSWFLENLQDFDAEKHGIFCWCESSGAKATRDVHQGMANPWGLKDTHGNVWEWCEEWWDERASFRVFRGGGCYDSAESCRSAFRNGLWPEYRDGYLGFRVAAVPG